MVNLIKLLAGQTILHWIEGWVITSELKTMWKELTFAKSEVLLQQPDLKDWVKSQRTHLWQLVPPPTIEQWA